LPVSVPAEAVNPRGAVRLGLVRCRRPADAVALAGWLGAINVMGPAEVAAVLRNWEERFGVVLAGLGFDTLTPLVPHPPVDERQALPIAAEIAALCPDALWQGPAATLSELAPSESSGRRPPTVRTASTAPAPARQRTAVARRATSDYWRPSPTRPTPSTTSWPSGSVGPSIPRHSTGRRSTPR
jgi:hypothetical protein